MGPSMAFKRVGNGYLKTRTIFKVAASTAHVDDCRNVEVQANVDRLLKELIR